MKLLYTQRYTLIDCNTMYLQFKGIFSKTFITRKKIEKNRTGLVSGLHVLFK